jgi:hypothetical protein
MRGGIEKSEERVCLSSDEHVCGVEAGALGGLQGGGVGRGQLRECGAQPCSREKKRGGKGIKHQNGASLQPAYESYSQTTLHVNPGFSSLSVPM